MYLPPAAGIITWAIIVLQLSLFLKGLFDADIGNDMIQCDTFQYFRLLLLQFEISVRRFVVQQHSLRSWADTKTTDSKSDLMVEAEMLLNRH